MYISINKWQFIGEFLKGPTSEFSYEGLCILYEYLNDSEEVLLNVKQVCNDYAEDNETELRQRYEIEEDIEQFLKKNNVFIGKTDKTYIYKQFNQESEQ